MAHLKKIFPILLLLIILVLVILKIEPPKSLASASILQIFSFFIPLFLLLLFIVNLFLKFYLKSFVISLGLLLLLILKSLEALSIITFVVTIFATFLIAKSLKKPVKRQAEIKKLFYQGKIPKLSDLSKKK